MQQIFQPEPQLQFQPLQVQRAVAIERLNSAISYVATHSPFYKEQFATHHLNSGLSRLEDLGQFPFTSKDDLQTRNMDFLCVPRKSVREYTATSGTMGKPVTIALTESDLQRLAYNEAQSFRCAGGMPEDIYLLALTLDRQFMAGIAYYSGIRALGAAAARTGPGLPALQWETAARLGATGIVAVPSSLVSLAEYAAEAGIDLQNISLKKAVCIGEPLRNTDFSPNALGAKLAAAWPSLLCYGTYAATELQTAFTECSVGQGGHHQPDLIFIEIVDEAGMPLPDGETGEVVITTLGIEGMPLLRFKTGDMAALHATPCACGRHSKRLGPIAGRLGQMIKYRGTTLYPQAILEVLGRITDISTSTVEAYTGELGTDNLRIHLHTLMSAEDCAGLLRPVLQATLRIAPPLQFHSSESMHAIQWPQGARKAVRFLDKRKT